MLQASPLVEAIVDTAARENMQGLRMIMQRESEFPTKLQAQLTGIGLDPVAREFANRRIDAEFQSNRLYGSLPESTVLPEVIIGSGFHAATYAATRVQMGKPAPYILERDDYVGGAFAIRAEDGTYPGVFNLNSRNRRGAAGLSGDTEAQLNYLPGAPVQAAALSNAEYQSNADIAWVIRMALAQCAPGTTFPGVSVDAVTPDGFAGNRDGFLVTYTRDGRTNSLKAQRVIDARGLGDPTYASVANGSTVLTFPQFLQHMTQPWPLRGLRNVAVIGGGDSGKCAVESFLGLGPTPFMAAAELDQVNRVDWYAPGVASTYDEFCTSNRGRYRAIGRYLRADKMGVQRLRVINTRSAGPTVLPGGPVLLAGRSYDMVIDARGNSVPVISGMDFLYTGNVTAGGRIVATRNDEDSSGTRRYRVGPRAELEFDRDEYDTGVADIDNNRVAMFRLATRTAALAVSLD